MRRRTFLTFGASATALVLAGHGPAVLAADDLRLADLEPDGLWSIYRRYRLMIVGQRDDDVSMALAGAVVGVLAQSLPTSRAQLARAADARRIGVLIGTNQQDVAIMAAQSAAALFLAQRPFEDIRNLPLRLIASFGSHVLVCRADLMANHAYLFAQTLVAHPEALPSPVGAPEGVVPAHSGSHAFFAGDAMPQPASAA